MPPRLPTDSHAVTRTFRNALNRAYPGLRDPEQALYVKVGYAGLGRGGHAAARSRRPLALWWRSGASTVGVGMAATAPTFGVSVLLKGLAPDATRAGSRSERSC